MFRYILRRILLMIPVLIGVTLFVFLLQAITPGDPAALLLGSNATPEDRFIWRESYGLNDSIIVQYAKYMGGLVKGDFGISYRTGNDITSTILARWPTTFLLASLSLIISVVLGMAIGIVAGMHRNTWIDSTARFLGMLGTSMPSFWFALLLIIAFSLKLRWLPVSGFYGPKYWVLPAATLGILGSASILRITRSALLDNMYSDFVRTARSKGQSEAKIISQHILPNAMIPITNNIAGLFAVSLGGTIILEQIFAIAGLGKLMVDAIYQRDFPLLRGSVLLVAVTTCVINLLVDLIYAAVDPRVKAAFRNSVKPIKLFQKLKVNKAGKAALQ